MDVMFKYLFMYGLCWAVQEVGALNSTAGDIRLLSGSSSIEGVVEYEYDGDVGLICDEDWSDREAEVVCRQLGYQRGESVKPVSLGRLSGAIWNRDYGCNGTEEHLEHCAFNTNLEDPQFCPSGYIAQVSCGPPHDFDVRLAGSPYTEQGRVEVFLDGEWGSITDGGSFDEVACNVVCNQLGYAGGTSGRHNDTAFERGTGRILIDELQCDMWTDLYSSRSTLPREISECNVVLTNDSISTRTHGDEIGAVCFPYESVANHPVRLVDESGEINTDYGRVEVYHDREWRSLCSENSQLYHQICLELDPDWSLTGSKLDLTPYNLSLSSQQIWFELYSCSARRFYQCDHSAWGLAEECPDQNIVGVRCSNIQCPSPTHFTDYTPKTVDYGGPVWTGVIVLFAVFVPTIVFFVILCSWRCYKAVQNKRRAAISARHAPSTNTVVVIVRTPPMTSDPEVLDPSPGYGWTSPTNDELPPSYEVAVACSYPQGMSNGIREDAEAGDGHDGGGSSLDMDGD